MQSLTRTFFSRAGGLSLAAALLAGCGGSEPGTTEQASSTGDTTEAPPTTDTPTTTETPMTDPSAAGSCGDGKVDSGEVCDGADLGGKTCQDVDASYTGGTLACASNCMSFDESGCELPAGTALIALNEISSDGVDSGPFAGKGDLIEVYNAGDTPADLSGYQISDDEALPLEKTYVFPQGTTLGPGEFLVLVQLDTISGEGDFPFGISQTNEETIVLVGGGGQMVDSVTFAGATAIKSYCRVPDGNGAWQHCEQTFGGANAAAATICGDGTIEEGEDCDGEELAGQTCEGLGLGFTGGTLACSAACTFDASACESGSEVVINELESALDDIELHNAGDAPIDLSGWILTDDGVGPDYDPVADLEKLVFAPNTSLAAGEFLVVAKGNGPGQHPFGLSGSGDTVTLLRPNLQVVDQVTYGNGEADVSYCRLPDGPGGAWTPMCTPTLGDPNQG